MFDADFVVGEECEDFFGRAFGPCAGDELLDCACEGFFGGAELEDDRGGHGGLVWGLGVAVWKVRRKQNYKGKTKGLARRREGREGKALQKQEKLRKSKRRNWGGWGGAVSETGAGVVWVWVLG